MGFCVALWRETLSQQAKLTFSTLLTSGVKNSARKWLGKRMKKKNEIYWGTEYIWFAFQYWRELRSHPWSLALACCQEMMPPISIDISTTSLRNRLWNFPSFPDRLCRALKVRTQYNDNTNDKRILKDCILLLENSWWVLVVTPWEGHAWMPLFG